MTRFCWRTVIPRESKLCVIETGSADKGTTVTHELEPQLLELEGAVPITSKKDATHGLLTPNKPQRSTPLPTVIMSISASERETRSCDVVQADTKRTKAANNTLLNLDGTLTPTPFLIGLPPYTLTNSLAV